MLRNLYKSAVGKNKQSLNENVNNFNLNVRIDNFIKISLYLNSVSKSNNIVSLVPVLRK